MPITDRANTNKSHDYKLGDTPVSTDLPRDLLLMVQQTTHHM